MENLKFEYEGMFITFSEFDGEDELRIEILDENKQTIIQYLCVEQVIALKDYLIKQLNNLPNEPKTVSNNEQKGKKCVMVTGEVNCCYKCRDIPYQPNI
jgi:hypothetical protein